jgi:Mg-chelatase subunit ChlD
VARIVPDKIYFKTRAKRSLDWHISIVVDVSGSMEPSVIHSALMASILQGLPSVSLSFIAFNTQVVDLSHLVDDPLSLLLEVEVGGGTHIAKALKYARERVKVPNRTILALVTDFEEGWSADGMVREARVLAESGVHLLGLAALDDSGKPRYNNALASLMVAAGMPVAALTPMELAEWVGDVMRGKK